MIIGNGYSFNFSKLIVADLDRSATFYSRVFRLEELARVEDAIAGRTIREVMYKPTHEGGATFVLLAFDDAPTPAGGEMIVGFTVADLDAVVAEAVAAGGSLADPIRDMPEMGIRVGFIRDPEGHLLEIVQFLSPAA
ncbi:MAG: VOC family protein [Candidatus Brevundimonas phytovorans]|nr:VOC family protein [Brevundimonas sp.]WEK56733.1 MAG: VOC family protein [Brevundimonas sp.]